MGRILVVCGILLIVVLGGGFLALRSYLHSESFRKFLSAQVSSAAKVDGRFLPFKWDGLAVETEGFEATGEGVVKSVRADRIGTEVGFGGVARGVWEIKSTRISRIDVSLDLTKVDEPAPVEPEIRKNEIVKKQSGWIPDKAELESLDIGELALDMMTTQGPVDVNGLTVRVLPEQGIDSYKINITGGNVLLPQKWIPPLRVQQIEGSYRDGSAFVTRADVTAWKMGRISAFGEWNFEQEYFAFKGDIDRIRCDEVLSEDWSRKLTGDISSSYSIDNRTGTTVTSGELQLRNGVLTALPMLDALAAYADTRRFRVLQLSDARTKWRYSDGELLLTDFVMGCEGLIRIEGNLSVRGRKIEGRFRLGLVPGTLSTIPGAETHVFSPGPNGLLWAPLHITGTLDDPKEDLTNRLIEAAGLRMFEQLPETGEQVLKFTRNALGETPTQVIDHGRKIIDTGGKVIEEGGAVIKEAEGIFRGILGN